MMREKEEMETQKRKDSRKIRTVRKRNKETVSQASMQIVGEFAKLQLSSASEAESENLFVPSVE